ncbi:hypothetical protein N7478_001754 [Penicillium angulare]|uniref:uncharacterized protein n=1 Tax=Penicillium angulare TaxID=116970 RepID=UPI002540C396|nr:uncharacterized protein N7478_001754 [Penicillium angulare]KAJ5288724.1 hypothetical protein N7478_001754 [Penicillium angulare]
MTAYIQRLEDYESTLNIVYEGETVSILDPTLQTAILTGLAQVNTPLEPICPSSHCEYPDFSTLGICSSCEDVTEAATQICRPFSFNETSNLMTLSINSSDTFRSVHANCSYMSPSGLVLTPGIGVTSWGSKDSQLEVSRIYFSSVARKDPTTIGSIFMAKYKERTLYTPENITVPERKPPMTEYSMSLCEREYIQSHFSGTDRPLQLSRSQTLTPKTPISFIGRLSWSPRIHGRLFQLMQATALIHIPGTACSIL